MRKLILQMQVSLDGFVQYGENDDQSWVTWAWEEIKGDVLALLDQTDTILIGRKLAMDYIPYWQETSSKPGDPMIDVANRIVKARKIVFSQTLKDCPWGNTELATGDLASEVNRLKTLAGKDIVVYGGTNFVSELIGRSLVDEFYFYVNPVVLGKGTPVFDKMEAFRRLVLLQSKTYPSGIILLKYSQKQE